MTQENVMSGEATVSPEKKPKKHNRQYTLRESLLGYLFASPWIIGFIALILLMIIVTFKDLWMLIVR